MTHHRTYSAIWPGGAHPPVTFPVPLSPTEARHRFRSLLGKRKLPDFFELIPEDEVGLGGEETQEATPLSR